MKHISSKSRVPFPFVIDELISLRPTIKNVFGSTNVYLGEKLLFSLRDSPTHPGTNGIWIYTTAEHLESLAREFPGLPRRQLWRSGKNAWVVLASRLEGFEEYAFTACELVLKGDQRIGRLTRRKMIDGSEGNLERPSLNKWNPA
ncbi:MAG TPA: hypothetical protein VFP47_08815 [Pyrinomonadaceae bacterium]|nr:hypothetical protein [Pyrinomonadaceae bacterium]